VTLAVGFKNNALRVVATISNSGLRGGTSGVEVLRITVRAKPNFDGVANFGGTVLELRDNTPVFAKIIGSKNMNFIAGDIEIPVGSGRRRRSFTSRVVPDSLNRSSVAQPDRALSRSRRERPFNGGSTPPPGVLGDVNCDSVFDGADALFMLAYISARGGNFLTALGQTVAARISKCQTLHGIDSTDVSFLDTDGNSEVKLPDLTYMLDVLAGVYVFFNTDVCKIRDRVEVVFPVVDNVRPPDGTRVYIDVELGGDNANLANVLNNSPNLITSNKGSPNLRGGLLEAVELDTADQPDNFHVFVLKIDLLSAMEPNTIVGLSIMMLAKDELGTRWRFFWWSCSRRSRHGNVPTPARIRCKHLICRCSSEPKARIQPEVPIGRVALRGMRTNIDRH
jgi:hypothetical protein